MTDEYFLDVQFMQTDAFDRGMGRYVQGLLTAVLQQNPKARIHCLYTKALPDDTIKTWHQNLSDQQLAEHLSFEKLDLKLHSFREHNYDAAYAHNKTLVASYLQANKQKGMRQIWLVPCLMQEPAVPVLPDDPELLKVVIWYDLIPYLLYDHYFPDATTAYAHSYLRRINLLLGADHILAISSTTKMALVEFLSIPSRRITVIDGSINEELRTATAASLPANIKQPFLLCPASPEPSKNVLTTIKGFGIFNAEHDNAYQLVITSKFDAKLAAEAHEYAQNVVFTDHIAVNQLKSLYQQCEALLFASTYEGLGLPILEAVNFNKKVICSDISVFREIGGQEAFYWCQPTEPQSIVEALRSAIKGGAQLSAEQQKIYRVITKKYSWNNSARLLLTAVEQAVLLPAKTRKAAVVGPHPASFSTIGKVIGETLPYMLETADVDYYYDSGPSDQRHGLVHFHHLQEYEHLYPIDQLAQVATQYDRIIYHMGSSDHHMKTYLMTKLFPDTVILHDANLGGKGLAGQMLSNGFMSPERVQIETKLETEVLGLPEHFLTSLVSAQKKMITHSHFAADIVHQYYLGKQENTVPTRLPIHTIESSMRVNPAEPVRLGLTGILSEVKGTDSLEHLLDETDNLAGCELYLFGFGFFVDKNRLLELASRHPNFHVAFDVSNLQFKDLLSKLDLLINYRLKYHGETSRTTLEAMRESVVPIVRDIGWFSELPDDTCFKLADIAALPALVKSLQSDPVQARQRLQPMIAAGQQLLESKFNFDDYVKVLFED